MTASLPGLSNYHDKTGLPSTTPLQLAARLFAKREWIRNEHRTPRVQLDVADDLTLKWASILLGYDRIEGPLLAPQYDNVEVLRQLNNHHSSEVAEYSVWALWQNQVYGPGNLTLQYRDIRQQSENVRRWMSRLATKNQGMLDQDRTFFAHLRADKVARVREGLALGLPGLTLPNVQEEVILWHTQEGDEQIKALLLEHMAANSPISEPFFEICLDNFRSAQKDGSMRKRLLSAAKKNELYSAFRKIEIHEDAAQYPELFSASPVYNIQPGGNMTQFNANRDIRGHNIAGGDIINNAKQNVQNISDDRNNERELLDSILNEMKLSERLPDGLKEEVSQPA